MNNNSYNNKQPLALNPLMSPFSGKKNLFVQNASYNPNHNGNQQQTNDYNYDSRATNSTSFGQNGYQDRSYYGLQNGNSNGNSNYYTTQHYQPPLPVQNADNVYPSGEIPFRSFKPSNGYHEENLPPPVGDSSNASFTNGNDTNPLKMGFKNKRKALDNNDMRNSASIIKPQSMNGFGDGPINPTKLELRGTQVAGSSVKNSSNYPSFPEFSNYQQNSNRNENSTGYENNRNGFEERNGAHNIQFNSNSNHLNVQPNQLHNYLENHDLDGLDGKHKGKLGYSPEPRKFIDPALDKIKRKQAHEGENMISSQLTFIENPNRSKAPQKPILKDRSQRIDTKKHGKAVTFNQNVMVHEIESWKIYNIDMGKESKRNFKRESHQECTLI